MLYVLIYLAVPFSLESDFRPCNDYSNWTDVKKKKKKKKREREREEREKERSHFVSTTSEPAD